LPSADPGRQHIRERQRALFYEGLPRPLFGLMGLNLCMSELPLQGASHGWRFYSAVAAVADEGGCQLFRSRNSKSRSISP